MTPVILKFKEKNSFLSLSSLDEEELSKTWRVCTKVKDSLENGSRLENLSWRLWFLQNINDTKSKDTSKEENRDQQQGTPESVLNYSLNDIKPNSFILNQFTSDQEGEQTIELKDIFPIEMQDYMYPLPENDPVYSPSVDHNLFINTNSQLYVYNNSSSHLTNHSTNLDSYITNVPQSLTNQYAEEMAHLFGTNLMESSIPSMTIPIERYTDYYSTIPNATLHNKMLATLPKQTLASAEKILSPTLAQRQQQHDSDSYQTMTSTFNTVQPTKKKPSSAALATPVSLTEEKPTICSNCEATSTPLWRRSDDKILCNACGLYLKLHNMPRPKHLKLLQGKSSKDVMDETTCSKTDEKSDIKHQTICSNCGTSKTPLWRRDIEGAPLCNACGLYLKLHNEKRPLSMKTDVIKKRQRTETLLAATTSEQLKKPKYFDHLALYSRGKASNSSVGYKSFGTSLPGTGILMMTTTAGSNGR